VVEEVEGLDDGAYTRWARPVRCRVGGGYTISRLAGAAGSGDSEEALVTLVLNVRRPPFPFGGCFGGFWGL
jgi:hypothetical protein